MRTVSMKKTPTPLVFAKYNFSTVIVLPPDEVIEYLVVPDKPRWFVHREGNHTFSVVPIKLMGQKGKKVTPWDGATNVQAIVKSGNPYPFHFQQVLTEQFDSVINVENDIAPKPKEVSECDLDMKLRLTAATDRETKQQHQIEQLNTDLKGKVEPADFVSSVHDNYEIPRGLKKDPFKVQRIYSHEGFTYIRSSAWRQPAFYEKSGKEKRHVDYQNREGVYIIPGEVHEGCMVIGKHTECFKRKG